MGGGDQFGYRVLAAGCLHALRGWRLALLIVAPAGSLGLPGYHFVILAHLHNVVPLSADARERAADRRDQVADQRDIDAELRRWDEATGSV